MHCIYLIYEVYFDRSILPSASSTSDEMRILMLASAIVVDYIYARRDVSTHMPSELREGSEHACMHLIVDAYICICKRTRL